MSRLLGLFVVCVANSRLFAFILFRVSILSSDFQQQLKVIERLRYSGFLLANMEERNSQLGQDIWALYKTKFKTGGYFVEVGACHPIALSNTYLLESKYSWDGLLIEPNPDLIPQLRSHRKAKVIPFAVGPEGSINLDIAQSPEFSRNSNLDKKSKHKLFKSSGRSIKVESWPLAEIFEKNNSPKLMDFMSIDVEGFELQVLESNDWNRWRPSFIAIEHNFRQDRQKILEFMKKNGYGLSLDHSQYSWDDFFEDIMPRESN